MSFVVDEELFNATKQGDIEKVKRALESGVSPNAQRVGDEENDEEESKPLLSIAAEVFLFIVFLLF